MIDIDYSKVPRGHRHTHTVTINRWLGFGKNKDTPCEYCNTESYWREMLAREIEDAVIEMVGDSAHTMNQAAGIVRGRKNAE